MELTCRSVGDQLLKPGQYLELRQRLRRLAPGHDLVSVIVYAYDRRARMMPFYDAAMQIAPAGVRAVGAALVDSGFAKTRIVLQQWNPNFRPSSARLDGRVPDLLLLSSMQIHAASCTSLLRDACGMDLTQRPLVVVGGPKAIYEPGDVFSADPEDPWGADAAVTGEEFVFMSLLEVLLSFRAGREPLRRAFVRARESGALERVPGLVYRAGDEFAGGLVNTGTQRLLADLDELPHASIGYSLLEPPSRRGELASRPLEDRKVGRHSPVGTLVMTSGCRLSCPYCPIPAYNQRQLRAKSGPRVADEMKRIYERYGISFFFGADDNFFADTRRALDICESLARTEVRGKPLRRAIRWATEVTVADTLKMRDHVQVVRKAGALALWMGVEDMTGTFVRKGQNASKTLESFALLRREGITPMPMLMHHDGQPLFSRTGGYGLLNQVHRLYKAGAIDVQVLILTPSPGSRGYEKMFTSGQVIRSAGGKDVEQYMMDGNYLVASRNARPWRAQLNVLVALLYSYNLPRLLISMVRPKYSLYTWSVGAQIEGMRGVLHSFPRMLGWAIRLMRGRITRQWNPPVSRLPIRTVADTPGLLAKGPVASGMAPSGEA